MRIVLLLLSILLVAACASANQAEPTDDNGQVSTAPSMAPDSLFDDVAALDAKFDAAIRPVCGPLTETSENIECLRGILLAGFDTTGEARNNCPATSMDDVTVCIVYGSLGYGLLQRVEEPEKVAFDWGAPVNSMHAVLDELVNQNVRVCLGQYPGTADSCYRLQFAKSLGLTDSDDAICGSLAPEDWERCIWKAFIRNEFDNARLRI
jgi:hypothetical protein